jgi:uncharacterized membrane protein YbhN (UPF0104 family)
MQRKKILSIVLSFILSIALIWILLSQIKFEDFVQTFTHIYLPGLFAFFAIALLAAALRAWRYRVLLQPQRISWGNIFLVTFIRNLFVDLFPARIGSLSYVYILNKSLKYSFESAASSFVVAFVLDFLTLSPFLVLSILAVGLGATSLSNMTLLVFSLFFFILLFLVFWRMIQIAFIFLNFYQWLLKVCKQQSKKWAETSVKKIRLTIDELTRIRRRKIDWPLFILSLGIRLAKYLSLYFLLFSLLRSHGFFLENLSFFKVILGITGAEMSSALPIKGIGGFGTWESAWTLTLMLLGFEKRIAILSSSIHLITNIFEYVLGISSILILSVVHTRRKK